MRYFNSIKTLAIASILGVSGGASAQQLSHPLSFGVTAGGTAATNWYANYVGIRFQVASPASIAGDKGFTTPNDGSGATGAWGAPVADLLNQPVIIGPIADTNGCAAYPSGYFTGKIALIWRGTCEFGFKALQAQNAGATAVIIVNNVSGGPVGMGPGASGSSVTIPVFMISLDDGTAIVNLLNAGTTVTMNTVLNWGVGNHNDLGFVPAGYAITANNAMPYSQLNTTSALGMEAYKNKDGAFVANFGLNDQSNVKLVSQVYWTPGEATTPTLIHSDSVVKTSFPAADSIWTMYMPKYNLPNNLSGPGKFTINYTVSSDSMDEFVGDNSLSYDFFATDSLYSKGRYDFANNRPYSTVYTGPGTSTPYIWTVPYFIANGGGAFDKAQFSVVSGLGALPNSSVYVYVYRWVDTALNTGAGTIAMDSFMENAELQLVGAGLKNFDGITDSSFKTYTVNIYDSNAIAATIPVMGNSWYVLGASLPAGFALGCDGVVSGYPRSYGRHHFDTYSEYYNPIWFGDRSTSASSTASTNQWANPYAALYPWSFDGTGSYVNDSVVFVQQKGLIPSIPFTTTSHLVGVAETKSIIENLTLYPNPTTDNINVALNLTQQTSKVTYNVIDLSGKTISSETHENVTKEIYNFNTSKLASGVYYVVVVADGKTAFRKFTVIR